MIGLSANSQEALSRGSGSLINHIQALVVLCLLINPKPQVRYISPIIVIHNFVLSTHAPTHISVVISLYKLLYITVLFCHLRSEFIYFIEICIYQII